MVRIRAINVRRMTGRENRTVIGTHSACLVRDAGHLLATQPG